MATKLVSVFIERLERFLRNPDLPSPCETEPVFEAGSWGLHMFFDKTFQTQVMNTWNATRPYYMGDWLLNPRHCFSTPQVGLPGEQKSPFREERYLHFSLHQIGLDYQIDYGDTLFFASIAAMVNAGVYRADDEREAVIQQLMRNDLNTPSLSQAQLEQYLALSRQLAWVQMNPNAQRQPGNIIPIKEHGIYGLHIFHSDPAVLELMRVLYHSSYPVINWGGASSTCSMLSSRPYLHLELGHGSDYLAKTRFFVSVR